MTLKIDRANLPDTTYRHIPVRPQKGFSFCVATKLLLCIKSRRLGSGDETH